MSSNVKWTFERDKCALIVVDMQNDFVLEGAILEVREARMQAPKVKRLIEECRALDVPIIYTVHETDAVLNPLEIASFPMLKNEGVRHGTKGVQIIDELAPEAGDIVIRKRRFSAFFQTDLEITLRNIKNKQIDTVIICGTMTNICCESTARDAFFRDFKVVFGSDVCMCDSPVVQAATLHNMEIFGRVISGGDIIKALKKGAG